MSNNTAQLLVEATDWICEQVRAGGDVTVDQIFAAFPQLSRDEETTGRLNLILEAAEFFRWWTDDELRLWPLSKRHAEARLRTVQIGYPYGYSAS